MIFVGLLAVINLQNKRIDAANNYIEELENTYPDYIGTVANTQAYIKWYSLESFLIKVKNNSMINFNYG